MDRNWWQGEDVDKGVCLYSRLTVVAFFRSSRILCCWLGAVVLLRLELETKARFAVMSDHGGAWVGDQWWQGDQQPQQQQQQAFQFLNQGHQQQVQQQLAAMGQQQAAAEQQQYSVYKMANSYQQHQNPSVSSPSAVDASSVAAAVATSGGGTVYEYGQNGAQHQHPQQQQWWYHSAINENLNGFASLQQMQTTIPVVGVSNLSAVPCSALGLCP